MSLLFPYHLEQAKKIIAESPLRSPEPVARRGTVVSAVQYRLKPMGSLTDYIRDVEARYLLAAERGSRLIAFPELFGITPLCCAPLTRRLFAPKPTAPGEAAASPAEADLIGLRIPEKSGGLTSKLIKGVVSSLGGMTEIVEAMLSSFSAKYNMLTASGSSLAIEGGKLYNMQTLYDSDGSVIGRQAKINPMESELALGVCYAKDIHVFDTSIGRVGIPVCMDASYFENFRIYYEKGARIIAMGTFNLEEYDHYLALRGLRPRCSEYPLYGVKSAMTGCAAGMKATGHAEIDAPCCCAPGGVVAKSGSTSQDELVSGEIFPEQGFQLDEYRQGFDSPGLRALLKELYAE